MDPYHLALFVHLLALVAASTASGLAHLAHARAARARNVGEALEWHAFGGKVARTFPIAVITLLATGGYMIASTGAWSWRAGWVQAGVVGAVLLFALGGLFGARMGRAGAEMARIRDQQGAGAPAPASDPVVDALIWVTPCIALTVVFLMATKPALPVSGVSLAIGIALGLVLGRVLNRSEEATAAQVSLG